MSGGVRPPSVLPMDARIKARRIAVVREEGRRRLRILVGLAAAVGLAGVVAGVSRSPLLDVERVEVVGAGRTSDAAVVRAGRLGGSPLMVSVDTGAVSRRVAALPWVLEARVERRWPATVRVELTERVPVAVVPSDEGRRWALVDRTGRVLAHQRERPPGLAALGGVEVPGPPGARLGPGARAALEVVTALPPSLAPQVADVAATPVGVELALAGSGAVVRLGEPTDLPAKLGALAAVLDEVQDQFPLGPATPAPNVAVIDVRVPSAPVLTRR